MHFYRNNSKYARGETHNGPTSKWKRGSKTEKVKSGDNDVNGGMLNYLEDINEKDQVKEKNKTGNKKETTDNGRFNISNKWLDMSIGLLEYVLKLLNNFTGNYEEIQRLKSCKKMTMYNRCKLCKEKGIKSKQGFIEYIFKLVIEKLEILIKDIELISKNPLLIPGIGDKLQKFKPIIENNQFDNKGIKNLYSRASNLIDRLKTIAEDILKLQN